MGFSDWKLKLRYGKVKTPFAHFTLLANCSLGNLQEGFSCSTPNAYVAMQVWAESGDQAAEIFQDLGRQIGYTVKKNIEIYETPAEQPPKDQPYAYGINFTDYEVDDEEESEEGF